MKQVENIIGNQNIAHIYILSCTFISMNWVNLQYLLVHIYKELFSCILIHTYVIMLLMEHKGLETKIAVGDHSEVDIPPLNCAPCTCMAAT